MASSAVVNYQNWHGLTDGRFGYGSMLLGFLDHKPKDVVIDPRADVDVLMSVPFASEGWFTGQYRVCFTMWETDALPVRFSRILNQYDEILVPCKHNIPVFGAHHPKVNYIPLGVDTEWWKPYDREPNQKFRFHAAGSLWMRKGLDRVVEAFHAAHLPNAELHIKAAPQAYDTPKNIESDRVFLHRGWMTREEQRDWFNQADCFVAPARGEGFGLIPLQAIALGVPTIITATSGQEQFAHLASTVVGHRKTHCFMGGRWDEVVFDELVVAMRHHYNNGPSLRAAAKVDAPRAEEFSWVKAAQKLADHLPTGSKVKAQAKWEKPKDHFEARFSRAAVCEVNGKRWEFQPGVTYSIPEHVHDIMSANGALE